MSIRASAEWNETFQEMDGFGVCGAFRQADNLYKYKVEILKATKIRSGL